MIVYVPGLSGSKPLGARHARRSLRCWARSVPNCRTALCYNVNAQREKRSRRPLAKTRGSRSAREIASHLSQCFEEAEFLVALHLDAKRFSKAEIAAGVSDVLLEALDHIWEAARVAGFPLPCLEEETVNDDDEYI
jgi:hypothetical protein